MCSDFSKIYMQCGKGMGRSNPMGFALGFVKATEITIIPQGLVVLAQSALAAQDTDRKEVQSSRVSCRSKVKQRCSL